MLKPIAKSSLTKKPKQSFSLGEAEAEMLNRAVWVGVATKVTLKELRELDKHTQDLKKRKTADVAFLKFSLQLYKVMQEDSLSTLTMYLKNGFYWLRIYRYI